MHVRHVSSRSAFFNCSALAKARIALLCLAMLGPAVVARHDTSLDAKTSLASGDSKALQLTACLSESAGHFRTAGRSGAGVR